MKEKNKIEEWILDYCSGSISKADREALASWLEALPEHREVFQERVKAYQQLVAAGRWDQLDGAQRRMGERLGESVKGRSGRGFGRWFQVAAVVAVLFGGAWLWSQVRSSGEEGMSVIVATNAGSGSSKATLKLPSREEIPLGRGEHRRVAEVNGVEMIQDSAGGLRLVGNTPGGAATKQEYIDIVVPEGGEYYVELGDGTKVWINADSHLRFPLNFPGERREVELTGEAYFEVKTDPSKPFFVTLEGASVRVLGTAFNVMAYATDRAVQVALLQGRVSFDLLTEQHALSPGEIATWDKAVGGTTIRQGDVSAIVAWKTGVFNYEDMSLEELVVKLERWYDVDFEFKDEESRHLRFTGAVTKYRPLNYILEMISKTTSVKFSDEEGRVAVSLKR